MDTYACYTWVDGQIDTKINSTHLDLCSKVPIKLQMDRCNGFFVIVCNSIDIKYRNIWTHICILQMDRQTPKSI